MRSNACLAKIIWTINTNWFVQTIGKSLRRQDVWLTSQQNLFLIGRHHVKREQNKPLKNKEEKLRRLHRYADVSLAFQKYCIWLSWCLKNWKKKDRIRFWLLPEGTSTSHVHGAPYSTSPGRDFWSGHEGTVASAQQSVAPRWDNKLVSGNTTASLVPGQTAWRTLQS